MGTCTDGSDVTALVLYVNEEGGTLKVLDKFGNVDWFVMSHCSVVQKVGDWCETKVDIYFK